MRNEQTRRDLETNSIPEDMQEFYNMSLDKKKEYLDSELVKEMLKGLPNSIRRKIVVGFLRGYEASQISGWKEVIKHFQDNSDVMADVIKNPAGWSGIGITYQYSKEYSSIKPIDKYLCETSGGGESLRNRLEIVAQKSADIIQDKIVENPDSQEPIMVFDLGSGPGLYAFRTIEILKERNIDLGRVCIKCIDIDKDAIEQGNVIKNQNPENGQLVQFVEEDIKNILANNNYQGKADLVLAIGMLCPLSKLLCKKLTKKFKNLLKPDNESKFMAARLTQEGLNKDFFLFWLLRELTKRGDNCSKAGWDLKFPPSKNLELENIFSDAGLADNTTIQEQITELYDITVGTLKTNN